jgi:hypothetical protein
MTAFDAHLVVYQANRRYVRFLNRINRPELGIVAVRIRPDMRRDNWLYRDILAALGKRPDVEGATQLTALSEITTAAWLKVHRIHTLIVLDAGTANRKILEHVLRFAGALELDLWLGVERHITPAVEDTLTGRQIDIVDRRTFDRTFAATATSLPAATSAHTQYPADVPATSYATFIDDVHRFLSPDDASTVHGHHRNVYSIIAGQVDETIDDAQIRKLAHSVVHSSRIRAELITSIRAFQQVMFDRAGVHVSFNERRLLGDQSIVGRRTAAGPETWIRMRAYRQPFRGAAAAAHAAGVPLADFGGIRLADVGDTHITAGGKDHPYHPGSEPCIGALWWERRLAGAADTDRLFAAPDGRPYAQRRLADAITVCRTDIGVNLYGHELVRRPASPDTWAKKHIASITRTRKTTCPPSTIN